MVNNEAGAFLNITPDVLNKLESFDKKLEQIQNHSKTAADALKSGFGSVVVDTSKLESAIISLTNKIGALGTAGNAVQNIGISMNTVSQGAQQASVSISSMAEMLQRIKSPNFSEQIMSPEYIAYIKESIRQMKAALKFDENGVSPLDATIKVAIEKQKALYESQLSDYRSFVNTRNKIERDASTESVRQETTRLNRMSKAMNDWVDKAKTAQTKYEDAVKRMNDFKSMLPDQKANILGNAMDFSKSAKSIGDITSAIKLLKQAREMLEPEKDKKAIQDINNAIAQHNRSLQQAGVQSQNLARHQRNLWDVSGQLQRQLALLFSVSSIEGYVGKIAQVRGEFELTQRSLQAILQNKTQADKIFNQTVELAVKSPFRIKELASYAKQLAAYRIESDKLFDTTKRLADVSAGLGVDMQRLILAYGQVKAAAYLRGTEVRQFTESGINLYGELQRYFQEVKGEAYTTAQIVDMISKRKVTFEDIENIFTRITDKGGLFYNMQEIQAETLQGKISNLKDSIDIMMNSIGKDNEGILKGSIDAIKYLVDNWEILSEALKTVAAMFVIMKLESLRTSERLIQMANDMGIFTDSTKKSLSILQLLRVGLANVGKALKTLGTALMSNIWTVAFVALAKGVMEMIYNYNEYNKSLEENTKKYSDNMQPINALIAKYNQLSDAAEKAKTSQEKNFDIKGNRKEREQILTQLADKVREYNIDPQIGDITKLSDKDLDGKINELTDKLRTVETYIREFANAFTEVNNRVWYSVDGLEERIATDAKELQGQGNKVLENNIKTSKMLDIIGANYNNLTDDAKAYYNEVKNGQDASKNESEVEWILRAQEAIQKITGITKGLNEEFAKQGLDLFSKKGGYNISKVNFFNEIDKLKEEYTKKGMDDPILLSVALDQLAIKQKWSDFILNTARQRLELPIIPKLGSEGESGNEDNVDKKHQRDILAERIALIKELNKEYEKLSKVVGSDKAAQTVMERYASQLKDVQMPKNIIDDAFLPNKENTARALQEFSNTISDFRKRIGAQKDANVLFDENDAEDLKKQLDKTRQNIEDMFNSLDLHQKLKDAGLSEAEVQALFPGLAKTLDDIAAEMEASYERNFPKGEFKIEGTDANKQYKADQEKLNQQRIKESQNLVIELTKAYKTQLSDQMQLDTWYIKERAKIYTKAYDEQSKTFKDVLTPEMQKDYEANLTKEYEKKTSENTWKDFQATDSYISMFENMDKMSGEAIQRMLEKLESLRSSLKGLPADQVRAIINQMEKLRDEQIERNPFKAAIDGVKELKEAREGLVKLNESGESTGIVISEEEVRLLQVASEEAEALAKAKSQRESKELQDLERQREELMKYTLPEEKFKKDKSGKLTEEYTDEYQKQLSDLNQKIKAQREVVNLSITEAELQGKISKAYADQLRGYANAEDKVQKGAVKSLNKIAEIANESSSAITDIAGNLENVFGTMSAGTKDTLDSMSEILGGVGNMAAGAARMAAGDWIGGAFQAVGGLAKTIGSIFAIGDKKKEREIQRQIKNVETLKKKYDDLKEAADNAYTAESLHQNTQDAVANIDQQIASYQAMIKAEQDKKKTDQGKIDEFNEQIKVLEKTKQEILDKEKQDLGGIGGEAEYRSAAEGFVQAWLDAFQETGDGLKGLEDNFDDMLKNIVLKQASMRIASKLLEPMFKMIDNAVEDSEMDDDEMKGIIDEANKVLPNLSEQLKDFVDGLGVDLSKKTAESAELSPLQQGIESITEQTANELQALLNSIRWFVSQQTTDTSAIKALIEARYALESENPYSNPMLIELRAQTGYLERLTEYIGRVFAPSANSKGAGLRVFIG